MNRALPTHEPRRGRYGKLDQGTQGDASRRVPYVPGPPSGPATPPTDPADSPDPSDEGRWFRVFMRVVSYLLLAVALAFACVAIVIPKVAGAIPVTILSNSMAPSMPVGSLAIIKPNSPLSQAALATRDAADIRYASDYTSLSNGDVVAYQPDPKDPTLIIHRIISMSGHADGSLSFTTKGDNNRVPDRETVADYQIRGTVWYHLPPPIGTINTWLNHNETNHIIAIAVIAGVGYFWALTQFILPLREKRRAKKLAAKISAELDPRWAKLSETEKE